MRAANILLLLGLAAALTAYSTWLQGRRSSLPPSLTVTVPTDGLPLLDLDEAVGLFHHPGTVFLDVRPAGEYQLGHIVGAVGLPEEELGQRLPGLLPTLRRAKAVVVYCKSRDCGKSLWAAQRLRNAGLVQTWIYPGGWNEWVNAGKPVHRGG